MNITSFFNSLYVSPPPSPSLVEDMYKKTEQLHVQITQHHFVQSLLGDKLETKSYHQYLVDLRHVYQALEDELKAHSSSSELEKIYFPTLNRSLVIDQDLRSSSFKDLLTSVSEESLKYADHLHHLGNTNPVLLSAHAYVRYLGDLSGGVIVKTHVKKKWPEAINFYDFSKVLEESKQDNITQFKDFYKLKLNSLCVKDSDYQQLIQEAIQAYKYAQNMLDNL